MKNETDIEIEGQLSFEDLYSPPQRLVAIHRVFARAKKEMSLAEQKTLVYALSQLKFKEEAQTDYVYLDKKTLAEIVGVHSDPNHLSGDLFKLIKDMPRHSFIQIADEDLDFFDSGLFITRVTMLKGQVRIKFEHDYLKLFTGLEKEYITMWSSDIFEMSNSRSVQLYEYIRNGTNTALDTDDVIVGIRELKSIFNIPKDGEGSYMREKGGFDRSNFEKRILNPITEDLAKSKMIQLLPNEKGELYEKVKVGNRVAGYRFTWANCKRPGITSAAEKHEIQKAIDDDPVLLKIAKDAAAGKKKPKKPKKNVQTDFPQRQTDYDALLKGGKLS